ncbi:MAG: hypothetical protein RBR69_04315 [Candidatus Cloacimonadaceae bacterium]|jgi:hypothetical protein|nr:hypothetical protein [Candidatus Cloacimonadota bacterium]MDY0127332.1 hypothetical protein [Candidatus Cloacimonadaceae bacterium]MCB5254533.1 hypothetical protein [Candidatus Cloacimonadota bacterium]MCK9178712.1 hypothetical protein [Candidatus Cloacimonadota bacterium]MCK9242843.1 hypothetical protein [Candidatus Cloacimonadota bacterium]
MLKLILASLLFLLYCIAFGIIWLHNVPLQFIALGLTVLLSFIILGARKLGQQLLILLPFVLMLTLVYAVFILLGISPKDTVPLGYWVHYGLPRVLLLLSSILAFRLCYAYVSVDDLIRSDLSIHRIKYLILGKILYSAAFHSHAQIKLWQELSPSMRQPPKGFQQRFKRALAATLGLVLFTLAEAETKGEKIDNLIQNCHKEL